MQVALCPCCGKPVRPKAVTPFSSGPVIWNYGSGFPKSLDISKAIDKAAGAEHLREFSHKNPADRPYTYTTGETSTGWQSPVRPDKTKPYTPAAQQWHGWGTALKPAWEPVVLAMKPLDGTFANNALTWGVAGLNVDGCRVGTNDSTTRKRNGTVSPSGWGGGYQKEYITGGSPSGRWPANLVLDEAAARSLDAASGERSGKGGIPERGQIFKGDGKSQMWNYNDTGGASRFFYVAKASRAERNAGLEGMEARQVDDSREPDAPGANNPRNRGGRSDTNHHPTVKPLALMRYLVRLTVTPTGGIVLDPFCGSGTTGVACMMEGRQFVGIDMEAEYVEIARRRIEAAQPVLVAEA